MYPAGYSDILRNSDEPLGKSFLIARNLLVGSNLLVSINKKGDVVQLFAGERASDQILVLEIRLAEGVGRNDGEDHRGGNAHHPAVIIVNENVSFLCPDMGLTSLEGPTKRDPMSVDNTLSLVIDSRNRLTVLLGRDTGRRNESVIFHDIHDTSLRVGLGLKITLERSGPGKKGREGAVGGERDNVAGVIVVTCGHGDENSQRIASKDGAILTSFHNKGTGSINITGNVSVFVEKFGTEVFDGGDEVVTDENGVRSRGNGLLGSTAFVSFGSTFLGVSEGLGKRLHLLREEVLVKMTEINVRKAVMVGSVSFFQRSFDGSVDTLLHGNVSHELRGKTEKSNGSVDQRRDVCHRSLGPQDTISDRGIIFFADDEILTVLLSEKRKSLGTVDIVKPGTLRTVMRVTFRNESENFVVDVVGHCVSRGKRLYLSSQKDEFSK